MKIGLYIHVPFCREKCDYCTFYSLPRGEDRELLHKYTGLLIENISRTLESLRGNEIDTLYIGGGTPSLLSVDEVDNIVKAVSSSAETSPDLEASIEMNPEDATSEKLPGYRDAGINRFILGIQTLDKAVHDILGRSGPPCRGEILERFAAFTGTIRCVDIITGVTGQSSESLARDLEQVATARIHHISAYPLAVERDAPLSQRISPGPGLESLQRDAFDLTIQALVKQGYRHYEISNYALPGFESRHNMKYWRFDPYLGFGPGAHSFFKGERYSNEPDLDGYLRNGTPAKIHDPRSRYKALVEYLMTGLRLLEGVSLREMEAKIGLSPPERVFDRIKHLCERGLVSCLNKGRDRRILLSGEGVFLADRVIYELVEVLLE